MRGQPYNRVAASSTQKDVYSSHVTEALAKQAANRPAKTPAKIMPVTPTLPKVPKPHRRRRRTV